MLEEDRQQRVDGVILHSEDNVGTLLRHGQEGDVITLMRDKETQALTLVTKVPLGHKCALERVPSGGEVRKYGEIIGYASSVIELGEHVHTHNLVSGKARGDVDNPDTRLH